MNLKTYDIIGIGEKSQKGPLSHIIATVLYLRKKLFPTDAKEKGLYPVRRMLNFSFQKGNRRVGYQHLQVQSLGMEPGF